VTQPVTVDFETEGILPRPQYPPRPVGVAIRWPGQRSRYFAWGHPVKNNCQVGEAVLHLKRAWEWEGGVLFHNAKFDLDVAQTHLDLPLPSWQRVHDTMFLLFLDNPHSPDLHLKSSAERILGLPPEERDAVRDWLISHQPVEGVKITDSKQGKEPWGKWICQAPGDLVGRYAIGDVDRTYALFAKLYPSFDEGMRQAYDRERRLLVPHLIDMERQGVRVAHDRLRTDVQMYNERLLEVDKWICKALRAPGINLDSGAQLVEALIKANKVDKGKLPLTATGKYQTTKLALQAAVTDKVVLAALKYRTQLGTCLSTFMEPWLETADSSDGLIYTSWHQCRSMEGGTRTGRLSSHPNFQNIPKTFDPIFATSEAKDLPRSPIPDLPPLPLVRSYIVPWTKGHVLIDRDYSQQEYRILAHYDDGQILRAYHENPRMDFHEQAKVMVSDILGRPMERKPIKNMGFGLLYGMGIGKLAVSLKVDVVTAAQIKQAYLAAVPGIKALYADARYRAKTKQPIRTWGGRLYYCEPPRKIIDDKGRERWQELDYKLPNVLIQGSAADCTKEAIIRYCDQKPKHHKLLLTVHDEFLSSVPAEEADSGMAILAEAMESVEFDVQMLSDGKSSKINWASLETCKDRVDVMDGFLARGKKSGVVQEIPAQPRRRTK